MKLSCSLLILAIAFSPLPLQPLAAQVSSHPPSAAAKDAFIRQVMEDAGIPGLQAVVVKRDKIVWSNSYGDAVLDSPGPRRAMNEHDLILTASTTKLCVTIAALQQLEKGKLALDDDINRSLPFPMRNPNWPDVPITWRMLLTHTSSIVQQPDALYQALFYWGKDYPLAFDDYVKARFLPDGKYHACELFRSGKPGSERIYSNDGFSLLAFALEQVTHESFDAYVRREIWTPLKMNETSYSLAGLSPDHLAVGYGAERKADGTFSFVPAKVFWGHQSASGSITDHQYSYPDYPVGRTYTNARDFARLILMFLNGGTVDGARILKPSSVDMIFTPSGYRNLDGWKQGIGVNGPLDLRGRQVWGHDGQGEGSVSALYVNRETGVGAFTIANSNYLDESQNYSLVDLDMHLMAWFEDGATDRAANYIPALEKGNGHAPLAAAAREPQQAPKSNEPAAQRLSSQQEEVWKGEQNYFRYLQAKDLQGFMSLWDENFLGWPDYSEAPLRKREIESGVAAEFKNVQQSARPLPVPKPEAIGVFGDVAVTHYFWPEADDTSALKYRITHTWRKGPTGWRIIGGMSCPVPRSAQATSGATGSGQLSKLQAATLTVSPKPDSPSTPAPHSVEEKVLELDRAWGQAYVKGDIDVIDRTLAPDWRGWLDTGGSDKASELAEFKAGKNRPLENIIDNAHVGVYGNTAVVEARERVRFRDEKGEHWLTWHITDVFVKRGGQWQVVASHGSTIPNP